MRNFHLVTGVLFLIIFALTGQYMNSILPPFSGELDAQRMIYRASHIYILMASLINLLVGIYYQPFEHKLHKILQHLGSSFLLIAQPVLLAAFIFEPSMNLVDRPYTLVGCWLLLVGSITKLAIPCHLRLTR